MQALKFLPHPFVLWVERLWRVDPKASGNRGQLLICLRVISDHAIGEALNVGVFRLLGELAELDLSHSSDAGVFDKRLVFLVQRLRSGPSRSRTAGGIGLAGLRKTPGCEEETGGEEGGCGKQANHRLPQIRNLAELAFSTEAFGRSSVSQNIRDSAAPNGSVAARVPFAMCCRRGV